MAKVNVNTYNNEEMVLIQFCGNIFLKIWIFSVLDRKSVTGAGKSIIIKVQFLYQSPNMSFIWLDKTLPKAQRTRGLSSAYQSNFFRSYHNFLNKFWSNISRILTKHQLQNLNQTSALRQNLNLKILTKPTFRISTKI